MRKPVYRMLRPPAIKLAPKTILVVLCITFVQKGHALNSNHFPDSGIVNLQKNFWKLIFGKYDTDTIVIHDALDAGKVIDVLPFKALQRKLGLKKLSRSEQKAWAAKYLQRYKLAAKRLRTMGKTAVKYGAMEKRVFQIYSKSDSSWKRLKMGRYSLRTQQGHADGFTTAAKRAQDYLPIIEKIFRKFNAPYELTRIAFVESMFNPQALSKVGASGMFQFMLATAKRYMVVNRYFDERNSPLKAARGAAQLLTDNYQSIGSWPLAITAYNHGLAGMKRAVQSLRSKDMNRIIAYYKSPSFGFASRNFYSEFLAAFETYQEMVSAGRVQLRESKLSNLTVLRLESSMSISNLLRVTSLRASDLESFNPCITDAALANIESAVIPKDYQILIPKSKAQRAAQSLKRFSRGS